MTSNNRSNALAALVLAGSALLIPATGKASLYEAATFDEKVNNAAAIVVGKVIRKETRYDADKRWILTYTTFRVEKTIKGGAPTEVTIVTPGGRIGDVTQNTVGIPVFEKDQESVVFLRNTRLGPTVLYHDQGAYDLIRDSRGERMVKPVASDAVLLDSQRGVAVAPEAARSLRQFETEIRGAERRARIQMEVLRGRKVKQPTFWSFVGDNRWLILIGALGVALATIQLIKRS